VLLVASIALYSVITNGIAIAYGNETRVLQASVSPAASVGPILISNSQVLQLVSAGILVAIWMRVYFGSRIGLYVRAAAQDPVLYESFGLNLPQLRTFSFFTASAMVAAAACTFSIDAGVTPERGMPALLDAVTATLLGGTSSATGPILGAIALGCLKGLVGWQLSEQWEPVLTLGLLVVLLVARPSGLRALIGRAV
jgi:branched-chain amino acid transport system permease protein